MRRIVGTDKVEKTDGTWSQATTKGNLLFISGQIGCDKNGSIVGEDFSSQAKQALENLVAMLEECGATLENLAMITVFVTDMAYRTEFAKIRSEYFAENPPASTMVEINHLCAPGLLIEINGIAVL